METKEMNQQNAGFDKLYDLWLSVDVELTALIIETRKMGLSELNEDAHQVQNLLNGLCMKIEKLR